MTCCLLLAPSCFGNIRQSKYTQLLLATVFYNSYVVQVCGTVFFLKFFFRIGASNSTRSRRATVSSKVSRHEQQEDATTAPAAVQDVEPSLETSPDGHARQGGFPVSLKAPLGHSPGGHETPRCDELAFRTITKFKSHCSQCYGEIYLRTQRSQNASLDMLPAKGAGYGSFAHRYNLQ